MKRNLFLSVLLTWGLSASAQQTDVTIQTGTFEPNWNSLKGWECPDWFKDAKFGIWAHWGPQCHAEDGDWYARFMYYQGSGQYNWHVSHFGNPKDFGLKDLCHDWKAQNWNPETLVNLYKSVEANGGTPNVVVTGKQLTADQKKYMMWDVERGIPDRMQEEYCQTCTCIGSWHYDQNVPTYG